MARMGMANPGIRGFIDAVIERQTNPLRAGRIGDLGALVAIENRCFPVDRIARPGFRRFLTQESANASQSYGIQHGHPRTLVVEQDSEVCRYAIILLRGNSLIARIFGVGSKDTSEGVFVMEVNDNPNTTPTG